MAQKKQIHNNAFDKFGEIAAELKTQQQSQAISIITPNEIRVGALIWTPVGLQVDGDVEYEDWAETGRLLKRLNVSLQWLIGDFIVAGEQLNYGKQEELAEQFGFKYSTVRVYASVARNVDLLTRVNNLSFKHHQIVAPLSSEQQVYWLQRASEGDNGESWPIARLEAEIRGGVAEKQAAFLRPIEGIERRYSPQKWGNLTKHQKKEVYNRLKTIVDRMAKDIRG